MPIHGFIQTVQDHELEAPTGPLGWVLILVRSPQSARFRYLKDSSTGVLSSDMMKTYTLTSPSEYKGSCMVSGGGRRGLYGRRLPHVSREGC